MYIKRLDVDMEFVYAEGLRHVVPYKWCFTVSCKPQWVRQSLEHVLVSTFDSFSAEYYASAFREGRILINGLPAGPAYALQHGDVMQHHFHRHELPIPFGASEAINIVYRDADLLVVDKPAGVPVHPSGRYHFNSLLMILQQQLGETDLFVLNRLDRLTSGLVLLARNADAVRRYSGELNEGKVSKTYLARVRGEFPMTAEVCQPIACVNREKGIYAVVSDSDVKAPNDATSRACQDGRRPKVPKGKKSALVAPLPIQKAPSRLPAKPAVTRFRRLHFDGQSSVVEALPLTGRTHQIRLHLQSLGYPIVNDANYGGSLYRNDAAQYSNVSKEDLKLQADCAECVEGGYLNDHNWYPTRIWLHSLQYEFCFAASSQPLSSLSPTVEDPSLCSPSVVPVTSYLDVSSPAPPSFRACFCGSCFNQMAFSSPTSSSSPNLPVSPLPLLCVRTNLPSWAQGDFNFEEYCRGYLSSADPKFNY